MLLKGSGTPVNLNFSQLPKVSISVHSAHGRGHRPEMSRQVRATCSFLMPLLEKGERELRRLFAIVFDPFSCG